ncbi:MAG: polymer-forming cytoskeletal protein [Phycisphaerales bacterium]|nr:polymer-forming cytoskeletal protein [Phycisphaerales bacterium]
MTSKEAAANTEITVIGRGTTIKGEVDFENGARILGVFEGKIRSRGEVQIGESAECKAEIDAEQVVIDGMLDGNITAHERLRLSGTARLTGDICATRLLVEEGASFVGHCRVGEAAAGTGPAKSRTPSVPTITTRIDSDRVDFKPPWRATEKASPSLSAETGAA